MQITENLADGLRREYTVVVAANTIQERVESQLKEIGRKATIKGFRQGRVPLPLLRKRYGQGVLGEVLEAVISDATRQLIDDHGLRPALEPKVEVTRFAEGEDLECVVALEILPEISLPDFSQVSLERVIAPVEDTEVEAALVRLATSRRRSERVEEERPAAQGDVLLLDFRGAVAGVLVPGLESTGQEIELGGGDLDGTLEAGLLGAVAGDHRVLEHTFPDDFPDKTLSGRTVVYDVNVRELRRYVVPEIDDAFAKDLGLDDAQDLKTKVREKIERSHNEVSRAQLKRQLLDSLAGLISFSVPAGMVEMEFQAIWKRLQAEIDGGREKEEAEKNVDDLQTEYRAIAERRVKLGLLLAEVGKLNNVNVSRDELSHAVMAEARRYPGQERQVYDFFQKNPKAIEQLRAPIFEDKVVDHIISQSNINERHVTISELMSFESDSG